MFKNILAIFEEVVGAFVWAGNILLLKILGYELLVLKYLLCKPFFFNGKHSKMFMLIMYGAVLCDFSILQLFHIKYALPLELGK